MRRIVPKPKGYHWDKKYPVKRNDGYKPCRWCYSAVHDHQKSFCRDDNCVIQWRIRTDHSYFRHVILGRDRGICAICELDTLAYDMRRIDSQIHLHALLDISPAFQARSIVESLERDRSGRIIPLAEWMRMRPVALAWRHANKVSPISPPWEVDHITPIVEGGDWFSLSNVRSLCCPCHRTETAKLRTRLDARRRARKK